MPKIWNFTCLNPKMGSLNITSIKYFIKMEAGRVIILLQSKIFLKSKNYCNTKLFGVKNEWHLFCTFHMIMRWFHTLSHYQFLLVLLIFVTFWQIDHTISSLWWQFLTRQFLLTWNIFGSIKFKNSIDWSFTKLFYLIYLLLLTITRILMWTRLLSVHEEL